MEHLVVPTFVLDATGRVMIWNRACEHLTGLPAREVVHTRDHWQGFYTEPRPCLADLVLRGEADRAGELYAAHASAAGHLGLSAENWCAMPRAGDTRYLAIDAGPIYDEAGRLIAVIETLRDMTVQKNAQTALEVLANQDGLTGVANRRAFDDRLQQEWTDRANQPLSLLLVDIDHFKLLNDVAGHQSGDACLQRIGRLIAGEVMPPGLVARYGGEEFAVILPSARMPQALALAERLLRAVQAAAIPHPQSLTAPHVTISVGVATAVPAWGGCCATLLEAADLALYQAKHRGRNNVCTPDTSCVEDHVEEICWEGEDSKSEPHCCSGGLTRVDDPPLSTGSPEFA